MNWKLIFKTQIAHHAEIVRAILDKNQIENVLLNKQDSSYLNFGNWEVYVSKNKILKAIKIIQDEVVFE